MLIIGSLLGLLAAFPLHSLAGRLRRLGPTRFAAFGWVVTVGVVVYGAGCLEACLVARNDPAAAISPPWGIYTAMVCLLLLCCAVLSGVQRRCDGTTGLQAFGGTMAEAGMAMAAALLFYHGLCFLGDPWNAWNQSALRIADPYALADLMPRCFNLSLTVSLLFLSLFPGRRAGWVSTTGGRRP